jgi:hypothetical protein
MYSPTTNNATDIKLIFLVSQPRAGSTLLQLMLAGSPEIATTAEPWIALHPLFALRDQGMQASFNADLARASLENFLEAIGADRDFYREQVAAFLSGFYSAAIQKQGKKFFLDKTPRYYYVVEELAHLFPNARFIILFRNPLAILASILNTWVGKNLGGLINYLEDLLLAPSLLLKFLRNHPDTSIRVSYEQIVTNPHVELDKICRFLQIDFDNAMLDYGARIDSIWKMGDTVGIRKSTKPVTDSVNRWKQSFITEETRSLAQSYLKYLGRSTVTEMGYPFDELLHRVKDSKPRAETGAFPLDDMLSVSAAFTSARDMRRAAFKAVMDRKTVGSDIRVKDIDWTPVFESMAKEAVLPQIQYLNKTINDLKVEVNRPRAELRRLQSELDRVYRTLSWRVTAPLRNSKILSRFFSRKTG